MYATYRQFLFGSQGHNLVTKASIMESLYDFEETKSHIHRQVLVTRIRRSSVEC